MNPQIANTPQTYECPPHDRALFDGNFSGRLRELAVGSSRRDALAAIYKSKLADWIVDDTKVSLELSGTHLVFNGQGSSGLQGITGSTPHGDFALPCDHWIAKQLLKRFDRRTNGFQADLLPIASQLSDRMFIEALKHEPRDWKVLPEGTFGPTPMKPSESDPTYGTRNFVKRTEATTDLGNGYYATIMNLTYFGVRTEAQAVSDYVRYTVDVESTRQPWLVSAPRPAGEYTDEYIGLWIHYQPLDRLRGAVGLKSNALYTAGILADPDRVKRIWSNSGLK